MYLSSKSSLYKNRNAALKAIQSLPILFPNPQTSHINLRRLADTVKDVDSENSFFQCLCDINFLPGLL